MKVKPPWFLHQNDRKGWTFNYLEAFCVILLRFSTTGENQRGGHIYPPLVRRRIKIRKWQVPFWIICVGKVHVGYGYAASKDHTSYILKKKKDWGEPINCIKEEDVRIWEMVIISVEIIGITHIVSYAASKTL